MSKQTPLEAADYARRRPGKLEPRPARESARVTEIVRQSSDPIPPGGDHARCRGFPYFPSDGGIDGAIAETNPGECHHGPHATCWLCRDL